MKQPIFNSFSAKYNLESRYRMMDKNEKYSSVYHCKYHVDATSDNGKNVFNYSIHRSDIRINNKKISKLMDKIICEIGDSIYPIMLIISPLLQILDILNFEEIKQRWMICTQQLSEKYPSYQLKKYIRLSAINFSDKKKFINALYQDTFINVYFRDIYTPTEKEECKAILWNNFPKREMNQTYLYQIDVLNENKIKTYGNVMQIIPEHNGHYCMDYDLGNRGEIQNISGKIETLYFKNIYQKEITIKAENLKTDIHFTENIII